MASLLDFTEQVRVLLDLPALGIVSMYGTDPGVGTDSVLENALGCEVGEVPEGPDGALWRWAMLFDDRRIARRVGIVMGLPWRIDRPAVRLPEEVSELDVADHFRCVEEGADGSLRGWWVPNPRVNRDWVFRTPTDGDLLPGWEWQADYGASRLGRG